ncbi:uncharacterized protein LOC130039686 [Sorex fumeus]|uniref:uncharacterized protein LOC130039686 n=1 Tax=Sorex fumeus TaxID=62283 RepID=UPI0024AC870E|nr:uncharacterized protein LOC130039686 [Sorex fumeus]
MGQFSSIPVQKLQEKVGFSFGEGSFHLFNSCRLIGPEPKPGDMIEMTSGCFKHWAVCVGPNSVVHLTVDEYETQGVESSMAANVQGTRFMVKKEHLAKVAAGFEYWVNNKHDGKRRVRSPENIVQMALALVGKEWPYRLTQVNSEHFAIELRYGEPICEQNRVGPEPKPGDLIEISNGGLEHWGVYMGDDYVVSLAGIDTKILSMEKIMEMDALDIKTVVKKVCLRVSMRNCLWWINNKHDGQRQVQFREDIVQNALKLVGQELPYSFTKENCERFVMQLRYVDTISDQNRVGPEPKPGDLIEISNGGLEHWGVYMGDDYVVSLAGIDTKIPTVKSTLAASVQDTQSVVKKQLLSEVVMGCMYRVNNKHDGKRRVRSPQNIVQIASDLVGQEWPYSFSEKNCEHFATELRYGEPISEEGVLNHCPRPQHFPH